MALMNLNIGLLIYEDPQTTAPKIRTPDITREYQQVSVNRPKSDEHFLAPGESAVIAATSRATAIDNTTELEISRPKAAEDVIRLAWTGVGTAPAFRTKRALGIDATTVITMTRIAPNTVRLASTSGTPLNSAAVVVGDILKMERTTDDFTSAFNQVNTGMYWQVQAKGTGYVDFLDNGAAALDAGVTLGADFDLQLRVMSPGPVRVGDTVELSGLNLGNVNKYTISDYSSDYVEYVNPFAVAETFTVNGNVAVYDRLIGFLFVRSSGAFKLKINGQTDGTKYGLLQGEALFVGSVEAHTVEAANEGSDTIRVTLQHASLM